MPTFLLAFIGPRHLAKELQLNSIDPSVHISSSKDNFAVSQKSKPRILAADYRPANIRTIANNCMPLTTNQREQLHSVLENHTSMFDGILWHYPDKLVHNSTLIKALRRIDAELTQSLDQNYQSSKPNLIDSSKSVFYLPLVACSRPRWWTSRGPQNFVEIKIYFHKKYSPRTSLCGRASNSLSIECWSRAK